MLYACWPERTQRWPRRDGVRVQHMWHSHIDQPPLPHVQCQATIPVDKQQISPRMRAVRAADCGSAGNDGGCRGDALDLEGHLHLRHSFTRSELQRSRQKQLI